MLVFHQPKFNFSLNFTTTYVSLIKQQKQKWDFKRLRKILIAHFTIVYLCQLQSITARKGTKFCCNQFPPLKISILYYLLIWLLISPCSFAATTYPITLNGMFDAKGHTLSDIIIGPQGHITNAMLAGTIESDGVIADVKFAADARLQGGFLAGHVQGNPQAPAFLENLTVQAESQLAHLIISDNVHLQSRSFFDDVRVRFVSMNSLIPELPLLGNSVEALSQHNVVTKFLPGNTIFAGGMLVNDSHTAVMKTSVNSNDKIRLLAATVEVSPEHLGKSFQTLIVACKVRGDGSCGRITEDSSTTRRVRGTGEGEDEYYQIVGLDERPIPWNGLFEPVEDGKGSINAITPAPPAITSGNTSITSGSVSTEPKLNNINILADSTFSLPEPNNYEMTTADLSVHPDNWRIAYGYRIVQADGSIIIVLSKPLEITVNPSDKPIPFPYLGQTMGINQQGQTVTSTSVLRGGIITSRNGLVQNAEVTTGDSIQIVGNIAIDPLDVKQIADILVVIAYKPLQATDTTTETLFMLHGTLPEQWNVNQTNALAKLKPRMTVVLESNYESVLYAGKLPVGQFCFFLGYRLPSGTIVFATQTLNAIVKPE